MTDPTVPPDPPTPTGDPAPPERWRDVVRHAVRGTGGDPTRGPLRRALIILAIPMVLEMVMESVFAVVDIFFVARLGAEAVTAVGITESLMTLVYTAAMGLSIGTTAMVSRRIGEGDRDAAARVVVQVVVLGVVVSTIFGVVGVVWADDLLRVMGAEESVIETGVGFTRVMFGTNVVVVLLFLLNAAFRGAGDAAIAMRVLWIANGINIVLDPCFIFGLGPFPEMGVQGAAVATSIGRGTAVVVQLWTLLRLGRHLQVRRRHIALRPDIMGRLVRLSGTGTLQTFIGHASWIGLIRILAGFGAEAVAGYTISIRIVLFALLPAWGLSNAAATMVGQGLGAGDPDRAERAAWLAGHLNLAFLGSIGVLFMLFAGPLVDLFGTDAATSVFATRSLRIISAGFFFYAYGMVLTAAFNGAGAAWTPTFLNLLCFWMGELPLAWFLAYRVGWGPTGVFVAVAVAFSALAVVSGFLFSLGRWKTAKV